MSDQCRGTTKSGQRCKIRNNLVNGYCRMHQDQASKRKSYRPTEDRGTSGNMKDSDGQEYACSCRPWHYIAVTFIVIAVLVILIFMLKKKNSSR